MKIFDYSGTRKPLASLRDSLVFRPTSKVQNRYLKLSKIKNILKIDEL